MPGMRGPLREVAPVLHTVRELTHVLFLDVEPVLELLMKLKAEIRSPNDCLALMLSKVRDEPKLPEEPQPCIHNMMTSQTMVQTLWGSRLILAPCQCQIYMIQKVGPCTDLFLCVVYSCLRLLSSTSAPLDSTCSQQARRR
jgi:hypothetical protein